jgi:hypothetical protein
MLNLTKIRSQLYSQRSSKSGLEVLSLNKLTKLVYQVQDLRHDLEQIWASLGWRKRLTQMWLVVLKKLLE